MAGNIEKTMRFKAQEDDYGAAYSFVEKLLQHADISDKIASEMLLIFEALFQKILDSELDEDTVLEISWVKKFGNLNIKVGFEGKAFVPYTDGEASIEDKILRAHDDKLDFSYYAGYNIISVSVNRSYRKMLFACSVAVLCAVVVYGFLFFLVDEQGRRELFEGYVIPLEKVYANAVLMIGAPMTFFSLLKNLTDTYIVSRRNSGIGKLQFQAIATSAVAIALAFVTGFALCIPLAGLQGAFSDFGSTVQSRTFADVVTSFVPPSIFEPFESLSPIPLMFIALLVTYALCSTGKHFGALRRAMDACYALFSRMLRVVIAPLPFFCFLAFMDTLLDSGIWSLFLTLGLLLVIHAALLVLFAAYAIRLRVHGIHVIPFARKLIPLIRENLKIGSAIDAAPFNIRYCARAYGIARKRLERDIPVLAQINLDGNCFIIVLIALFFMFTTGIEVGWLTFAGIAMLVLFLSLGAPNQPGSILIGTLIITSYLHTTDMMCVAFYTESFLGSTLNIVNTIGDIVTVAIAEQTDPSDVSSDTSPKTQ